MDRDCCHPRRVGVANVAAGCLGSVAYPNESRRAPKGTQLREGVWGRDGASRTCRSAGGFVLEVQNRILMYVKFND